MEINKQAERLEKKMEERFTILWHEIEEWQQDNHYIHSGYRPASNSYVGSAKSLTYLHNESVNIYTHLLGAIVVLATSGILYSTLAPRYETATKEDLIVFACYFFGATACLGMSATFHMISNHSPEVARWGNQLDYLGIVFLIWGSFVPSIYYGFQDDPVLIQRYWIMITTIGAATAITSISPQFRTPSWRPFRAAMFVAMGLSAVIPVIHGAFIYSLSHLSDTMALPYVVAQGILYIIGAGLYAARFPERMAPGSFDIWGSSHQIFHVLVLMAAATHLYGLVGAFDYRHGGKVVDHVTWPGSFGLGQ
ncbi:HlyIII-domain-containing protein [Tothia fuscella]|uniref:HlyIII-domain-containing protein n=1 Tax=Tothia fuscella TaxID=1048955 RepID=A0A9P4U0V4_9PEZI|nr:HlyIII-domain-containing protein [Tothia fuscella]